MNGADKIIFIGFAESFGKLFQLNTSLQLRVVCQIAGNNLLLMKMAHLDGYIAKDLSYSRLPSRTIALIVYPFFFKATLPCRYTSTVSCSISCT